MKITLISSIIASSAVFSPAVLVITEVMSDSGHPGGSSNGDWFELTNTGSTAINLAGYYWEDENPAEGEGALFPAITLNSMSSLVIVNEGTNNIAAFLATWGGGFDVVSRDEFTAIAVDIDGDDILFSNISNDGDQIAIWDANPNAGPANLVTSVTFPAVENNEGRSLQWDTNGTPLGLSTNGQNGAFIAFNDGDGGAGIDIASPGITVVPEPSVALLAGLGFFALLRRRR